MKRSTLTGLTTGDFDDIRRSAGLASTDEIRGNDFVLALLIRLGTVKASEMVSLRSLFSILDKNGNGALDIGDIEGLIMEGHDARNLAGLKESITSAPARARDDGGLQLKDFVETDENFDNPLAVTNGGKSKGSNAAASFETEEKTDET